MLPATCILGIFFCFWGHSLGYLLIYLPQIATVMKLILFCSLYGPVSHTMFFSGQYMIPSESVLRMNEFPHFWPHKVYSTLRSKQKYMI